MRATETRGHGSKRSVEPRHQPKHEVWQGACRDLPLRLSERNPQGLRDLGHPQEIADAEKTFPLGLLRHPGSPNLSRAIATILVDITSAEDTPLEGFLITLRSASSRRAAEMGRVQIEAGHHQTMTAALAGWRPSVPRWCWR